ncbi:hypothetical protein EVG20_g4333 [Dentipellis fragilis]|uniref:Uncharacterized protein n=1 Tax=Dentipellis fragilis TaxID=205917 RepID=A0A4Y9YW03_9AGAM|nr:hypothetical protein EVG20_g4333 [Dentipellis fragilis]
MSAVAPPELDSTLGAALLGVFISAALYGVLSLQSWAYFRYYNRDPLSTRLLVGLVWLCETIHQVLISHAVYSYVVTNYANPSFLQQLIWSATVEIIFHGLAAILVQGFFTLRIYHLSNQKLWLTAPAGAFAIGQLVITIIYAVKSIRTHTFSELDGLRPWTLALSIVTVAANLTIATTLCILLHKSRTTFRKSDSLINKLIIYTINTGFVTSLDAIIALATVASMPHNFVYMVFFFSMGRLYSNSLVATLNTRKKLRAEASTSGGHTGSDMAIGRGGALTTIGGHTRTQNISIKIDTTQEFATDPHRRPPGNPEYRAVRSEHLLLTAACRTGTCKSSSWLDSSESLQQTIETLLVRDVNPSHRGGIRHSNTTKLPLAAPFEYTYWELTRDESMCSPIHHLPPELLSHIFYYSTILAENYFDYGTRLGWIDVTHVCRRWRSITLDTAKLWRNIRFDLGPHWAEELLARARAVPIRIRATHLTKFEIDCISQHIAHLEVLDVQRAYVDRVVLLLARLQQPAPLLAVLKIASTVNVFEFPATLFACSAPNLRHVVLEHCSFPERARGCAFRLLCNLTVLDLRIPRDVVEAMAGANQPPSLEEVLCLMNANRALEQLILRHFMPSMSTQHAGTTTPLLVVDLPCLSRIELAGDAYACSSVLRHIGFPPQTQISVDLNRPKSNFEVDPVLYVASQSGYRIYALSSDGGHVLQIEWRPSTIRGFMSLVHAFLASPVLQDYHRLDVSGDRFTRADFSAMLEGQGHEGLREVTLDDPYALRGFCSFLSASRGQCSGRSDPGYVMPIPHLETLVATGLDFYHTWVRRGGCGLWDYVLDGLRDCRDAGVGLRRVKFVDAYGMDSRSTEQLLERLRGIVPEVVIRAEVRMSSLYEEHKGHACFYE